MSFLIDIEPYTELYIESYTDVYRYKEYGCRASIVYAVGDALSQARALVKS